MCTWNIGWSQWALFCTRCQGFPRFSVQRFQLQLHQPWIATCNPMQVQEVPEYLTTALVNDCLSNAGYRVGAANSASSCLSLPCSLNLHPISRRLTACGALGAQRGQHRLSILWRQSILGRALLCDCTCVIDQALLVPAFGNGFSRRGLNVRRPLFS